MIVGTVATNAMPSTSDRKWQPLLTRKRDCSLDITYVETVHNYSRMAIEEAVPDASLLLIGKITRKSNLPLYH
ncbi:hypothetical protein KDAU_74240 [Dictyobacter aurantiacus]|uniref:Uncharacterized protein n=1 Tax=Dictyobacter aurantiacus TaxID=1936993 RepID=A0A401ZT87_9CHLR|nr:hypothetical protein KDAU_74240 [Dictyobacter aurantiacus]